MNWVRNHVRSGSWLAVVALAVNFALSFGHLHLQHVAHDASVTLGALASTSAPPSDDHHGVPVDDLCPICLATARMGPAAAVATAQPADGAFVSVRHSADRWAAVAQAPRAAFWSRGPPIS